MITVKPPALRQIGTGTFQATPRMRELIDQVLDSGRITYGPMSLAFEQRFAELHSCKYAILSNSGTSALQVALMAMKELHDWADGDEVIVPATTFIATSNIVLHCNMIPVFADVDEETYNVDPFLVSRAVGPRTRCVIAASLFGQPADFDSLRYCLNLTAGDRHIKLIEDSCETMFVKHCGKSVGAWGNIACFSTYAAHLLVTGVGGLSLTNNAEYAAIMRSLVNHGLAIDCLNPGENFSPQPMTGRRFVFDRVGYSYRITELEAAIGLAQLDGIPTMLAARRRNAQHLTAGLTMLNEHWGDWFKLPFTLPDTEHAWMMYPLVLTHTDAQHTKETLIAHLNARGIETRDLLPLLDQPVYSYLDRALYPVSSYLVDHGLYIGCHQGLDVDDIRYVVDALGLWCSNDYGSIYA